MQTTTKTLSNTSVSRLIGVICDWRTDEEETKAAWAALRSHGWTQAEIEEEIELQMEFDGHNVDGRL